MFAASPYRAVATRSRPTPRVVEEAPSAEGRAIRTTPENPTTSPAACRAAGADPSSHQANSAANRGMAPLIIPATEDATHCWATANSSRGTAIHTTPSSARRGQSSRATGLRARAEVATAAVPRAIRRNAIRPGPNASSPSAMKMNDEPHIAAMAASSPHSAGPNASARVPRAVEITVFVRIRLG